MTERDIIECSIHGEQEMTFLCQHLVSDGEGLGFNTGYSDEEPDEYYPDAWCDDCAKVLESEGEWNDTSEAYAGVKVVCGICYDDIRAKNWKQDDQAWDEYISECCEYLSSRQEKFLKDYNINAHGQWGRDEAAGLLTFSHNKEPQVECEFHFVGSLSLQSNTWMWAWANESLSEQTRIASRGLRELGNERGFLNLSAHLIDAKEHDAGHYAAIMAKEMGALGIYRTFDDDRWIYMVITKAKWVKKKKIFGLFG